MDFDRMLRYCSLLEQNNNRTWFHEPENHKLYICAKQDFTDLVEELKYRIAEHTTPDLAERLIFADPRSLLFRVPRDMRTNKGKPPYNPRWSADLSGDRHSTLPVGYYVHIQPGNHSMFGTGAWCRDSDMLLKVRSFLSGNYDRFCQALESCGLPMEGSQLKSVPRGFDPDDPAAEYLKYKSWLIALDFPDTQLQSFDAFLDTVVSAVDRMEPLRVFFNDALSGKKPSPFESVAWDE